MRNPAGEECQHYYEDFNRGREIQECRLIKRNRASLPWTPDLCAKCEVPAVRRRNPSPDLRLELSVSKRFGLFTRLDLQAFCLRLDCPAEDPKKGCELCLGPLAELD